MIPKALQPFASMIDSVCRDVDGWWVSLRSGYATDHGYGETTVHESTVAKCRQRFVDDVRKAK